MSIDYRYWTGNAWTLNVHEAKRYELDWSFDACRAEAKRLLAETGIVCHPTYLH
jgi:hypothetical protein